MKVMIDGQVAQNLTNLDKIVKVEDETVEIGKDLEVDGKVFVNGFEDIVDSDIVKLPEYIEDKAKNGTVQVLEEVPDEPDETYPTFIYVGDSLYVLVNTEYEEV